MSELTDGTDVFYGIFSNKQTQEQLKSTCISYIYGCIKVKLIHCIYDNSRHLPCLCDKEGNPSMQYNM